MSNLFPGTLKGSGAYEGLLSREEAHFLGCDKVHGE
jgi:hypothetical protein